MNRNNLSWVDNKVFTNPGSTQNTPPARPYMDTTPAPVQGVTSPTGVSPATYQGTGPKTPQPTGVSPAVMPETTPKTTPQTGDTMTGLSPAQYQAPPMNTPMGVSPAQYQAPTMNSPMGVSPAQYQAPTTNSPMGVSPAQYQSAPDVFPVQTGMPAAGAGMMPSTGAGMAPSTGTGMGMPGTLTRDVTYGPSPFSVQGPPTVLDPGYIPAYLRTQIGKRVRAEFNIGTNLYTDRTGILKEVGISYFVLEDLITRATVMCDLYSLKFLTSL